MKKESIIILAEPSAIISEGVEGLLQKSKIFSVRIIRTTKIDELQQLYLRWKPNLIIINPSLVQSNMKLFQSLKNDFKNTSWAALIYAFYDAQFLSAFDAQITVTDSHNYICNTVRELIFSSKEQPSSQTQDVLSERETDVLKHLAMGLANKEIADRLNISINTVMTHRKNITQKTGIKTISGLTIYAVVQKLIQLDDSFE